MHGADVGALSGRVQEAFRMVPRAVVQVARVGVVVVGARARVLNESSRVSPYPCMPSRKGVQVI